MGMDVFGADATNEAGQYFRNNVWWWHPLATFIQETYPDVANACEHWHTNDGDGLDDEGARELADLLDRDLANGRVAAYADQYQARLKTLPKHECSLCKGTGLRTDEIGVQWGFDKPRDEETGKGGCNGCRGTGWDEHPESHYPFSVENVREFAEFVRHSGGFAIW